MAAAAQARQPAAMKQENLKVEEFSIMQGMNTQEDRSGLSKGFWSWLMNFQPIGQRTLRVLNGKGTDIYTLSGDIITNGRTYIIGSTYYAILFTLAGAAYQVNLSSGAHTTVGTSGTFYGGSGEYPAAVDFGNSGILIVSPLGYWAWDGTTLFAANAQSPLWLSGMTAAIVTTGTTHTNTTLDSLATTAGVVVGMGVVAADIPTGTTVTAINSATSVTISAAATGSNSGDAVTFNWLMPTGIVGNAIEIYNASPWIMNGRTILASAPGNGSTFAASLGGVSVTVKDSYIQTGYTGVKQLDGFLYLFAHSAVDVISDVQTSGSPSTTTFLRVNVSSIIGTPWRDSIAALPSSIAFANTTGAYEVSGGQARKVSDAFDGIFAEATYPAAATDPSGYHPSATIMTLNETVCYALTMNLPDPDDTTDTFVPVLGVWDGKRWFLTSQESATDIVLTQDKDSVLIGWASTGTTLFQMFKTASVALTKKAKSWFSVGDAGVTMRKELKRIYAQFGNSSLSIPLSEFNIDTENGSFSTSPLVPGVVLWTNNSGQVVSWVNNSLQVVSWTGPFSLITGGISNVISLMFGVTIKSVSATLDIVGLYVGYNDYSRYQ